MKTEAKRKNQFEKDRSKVCQQTAKSKKSKSEFEFIKMEEVLSQSEEKFRSLTNQLPIGVYRTSKEGKILYANPALASMLGYDSVKEFMKTSAENTYNDPNKRILQLEQWKESEGITRNEIQLRTKNGKNIWVWDTGRAILDKNGEIEYIDGTIEDITDRKKAEEKINAIYELSRETALNLNIDQISETISDFAEKALDYNNFTIFLVNEEENSLYIKNVKGFSGKIKKLIFPIDERKGIIVHAAKTGESVYVPDVSKDSRYIEEVPGIRSELAVPMKIGEKVIGVLNIESEEVDGFSENDKRLLEALASHTVIAVQNAQLYEKIQQELTERKQAEKALQSEKAYLDQLIENAQEAIVIAKNNGSIIRMNSEFTKLFGYPLEEAVGKKIDDLVAPENDYNGATAVTKDVAKGKKAAFETVRQCKDGTLIHVSVLASPIIINDKQVGVFGIYRDITDRKETEEELQTEKAYLEQLIESAQEAIVICDNDGYILRVNEEFTRLFGHTSKESVGQCIDDLVASEDFSQEAASYTKQLAQGKKVAFEGIRRRKDGSLIHVSTIGSPITVGNVQAGHYAIYRDITDRKKAEKALQFEKAHLEQLFQSAQEAIVICDNDGYILRVNEEFTRLFGYTDKESVGQCIDDLVASEDFVQEAVAYTKQLAQGKRVAFESIRHRKDGSLIHVSGIGSPIMVGNEQIGHYAIYRDITKRKQAENEVQNTLDKLRKAMRGTIQAVALTVETRDPYTAGHQQRVADLARAIATEMGLSKDQIDGVRMAGLIHDIGKISVPAEILSKPSRLTEYEFDMIKAHSQVGHNILKKIEFPWPVANIVLQHHERINGSGYPSGLTEDKISLEAKIIGVADVVEAMASHRPYRPSLGMDKALEEITQKRGILYDPVTVDACLKLFKEKNFTFRLKDQYYNYG